MDPELPFPKKMLSTERGVVEEYDIPPDRKEQVLAELYPFVPIPGLDDEMYDIHEHKKFRVGDFKVTREGHFNFLVSPYYFNSGGTVIDWVPPDDEDE